MRIILLLALLSQFSVSLADNNGAVSSETLRTRANEAIGAGEINLAVSYFEQLLKQVPNDGPAHYQLATLYMDRLKNLDIAEVHFNAAKVNEFRPMAVGYRLSRIYARRGQTDKALAELETIADGGFSMVQLIENESDYEAINQSSGFLMAVEKIRTARYPCTTDQRKRAFDFWLGEWNVTSNGQFAGHNDISSILGGCALFEQWTSVSGVLGKSFNYYDPAHDHWRQIWIDDTGNVIEFTGEARDGGIFYTAETLSADTVTHHKFEFTQNEDGSVRQFWQTSTDKATWTTIWDGRYAPIARD